VTLMAEHELGDFLYLTAGLRLCRVSESDFDQGL
jgi:hypothetical protein